MQGERGRRYFPLELPKTEPDAAQTADSIFKTEQLPGEGKRESRHYRGTPQAAAPGEPRWPRKEGFAPPECRIYFPLVDGELFPGWGRPGQAVHCRRHRTVQSRPVSRQGEGKGSSPPCDPPSSQVWG